MTEKEALSYIHSLLRFGMKPGLERVSKLLAYMGEPQKSLRFVHVAGTSGKGSTCAMIAACLQAAGYRTGLYTSPFVLDFRERMQINGEMIPPEELAAQVEAAMPLVEKLRAKDQEVTEFELVTALALRWFAARACDVVVLEVGLGGRFDATNVIDCPLVSIIGSIGYDHTEILGDTLEKIAFEKCGIIKPGGVTVSYPKQEEEALAVIRRICRERGNCLLLPGAGALSVEEEGLAGSRFLFEGRPYRIRLAGRHQVYNAVTALTALCALREQKGLTIPEEAMQAGLLAAALPARFEKLGERPLLLLDGAHNPAKGKALAEAVEQTLRGRRVVGVMGMLADKDYRKTLSILAPRFAAVYTLTPPNPRALPARELAEAAEEYCAEARPFEDPRAAVEAAVHAAGEEGAVLVCGSLFLAEQLRPVLLELAQK